MITQAQFMLEGGTPGERSKIAESDLGVWSLTVLCSLNAHCRL